MIGSPGPNRLQQPGHVIRNQLAVTFIRRHVFAASCSFALGLGQRLLRQDRETALGVRQVSISPLISGLAHHLRRHLGKNSAKLEAPFRPVEIGPQFLADHVPISALADHRTKAGSDMGVRIADLSGALRQVNEGHVG